MSLLLFLVAINALTAFLYWWDKRCARKQLWRVPEAVLLLAGFAGGSVAGFAAQRILRHKNRKTSFQVKFWVLVLVQIFIVLRYHFPSPA